MKFNTQWGTVEKADNGNAPKDVVDIRVPRKDDGDRLMGTKSLN